jgi:hypothetical protein
MKDPQEEIHGYYTVSNAISYGVILSDCGDSAKLVLMKDEPETTDWLDIEWVVNEDGEVDDEGFPELEPFIDPNGFNVPLNLVMRA